MDRGEIQLPYGETHMPLLEQANSQPFALLNHSEIADIAKEGLMFRRGSCS